MEGECTAMTGCRRLHTSLLQVSDVPVEAGDEQLLDDLGEAAMVACRELRG